jgi:DNA-binding transcriptional MocR family regulator
VEEPTYDRAITIFRRAGAQVVGLPLEDDGLDVEVLEKWLIKGGSPVFLYTIPDFQNPSGTVLSREKRQRVAELARKHGFWIIEDVPYRKLRYAGNESPPIFASAPERVVHMASYSKLISPGLRVGFAIAPEPLAGQLAKMAEDTYVNPSYLNQAIVYEFLRRGWLQPQLAQLKALYKPRLDALLSALDAHMSGVATWCKPEGGFFVGLTLNDGINAADLLARARAAELILTDGRGFYADGGGDRFIRLPFCALRPDEISEGIARLAQVVQTTA